ncbi:MAG: hypothetical protein MI807_09030 [Verrucomicrobiales bacterium]|nr:hypothetical protein [Verrucomicrobiales bacterium]
MAELELVETEVGNRLMELLLRNDWKVTTQYSPAAFDKGIDFDSYTLVSGKETIELEWTNWEEWTIRSSESVIAEVSSLLESLKRNN